MDWFKLAYTVLGGLGIFFYGMKMMSDNLQSIGSDLIRKIISSLTRNRIAAVVVGLVVTVIIQSSSITTVMVVGFVNAGLMNLTQAIGVVLGANIGTTITGWIIAVKIGKYSLLIIGLALIPLMQTKSESLNSWGKALFGLGMIFLGLQTMSGAFKPLRTNDDFIQLMTLFTADSYLSLLATVAVGCVMTFIVQSSSAMLGITIALASTGAIEFQTAAALVMGENIGTTITAFLAGIPGNTNAKRAALAHSVFNVLGVFVLSTFFWFYIDFIENLISGEANFLDSAGNHPYIAAHIAASHTIFNVVNVLIFLPFVGQIEKLVSKVYPEQGKEVKKLSMMGTSATMSPSMGLAQGKLEIEKMGAMAEKMVMWSKEYYQSRDKKVFNDVLKYESITDSMHQEIMTFASHLMEKGLSHDESNEIKQILKMSDEIESIGDYCQKMVQHTKRLESDGIVLDEDTSKDIINLIDRIHQFLSEILKLYKNNTPIEKNYIMEQRTAFVDLADQLRDDFINKVEKNNMSPMANLTVADIAITLKRLFSHSRNIAEWHLGSKIARL